MNYDHEMFQQEVQFYFDMDLCPKCCSEVETIGMHERDSSGDIHRCTKCGWECGEISLWGLTKSKDVV